MPVLPRDEPCIRVEGVTYTAADFTGGEMPDFASRSPYHRELGEFLQDWFSASPFLSVQTSGSTGAPKVLQVEKERMRQSARMTCAFLRLRPKDSALLCMPLRYIAAKMMVVRALVAGLDLYPVVPSGHPLRSISRPFHLAALVPLQVFNSLQNEPERKRLSAIHVLLIGGGVIDPQVEVGLRSFPNAVYSTYGMTETLSHIALRRVNGTEASPYYTPFDSVMLSLSEEGTLCIEAPLVHQGRLVTHDIAELLPDGRFRILGRKDNVINSGGIKIQIEEMERLLAPLLPPPFAVTSLPDVRFGEIVVLVTERPVADRLALEQALPPYHIPRKYVRVEKIPLTETGKISRSQLKELVLRLSASD
ncbi:AMP-binding protein [Parabacteroides sp. Marseille-P3160]|uniref:AMP-binding protein n=1 Tax=Parabacteroides sp. Marseille-P3160 TaxID=1917887 RepID=UPI001F2D9AE1|nr:AMP-binding protein [Parabacteroides sp. Marseille-P3160]